MATEIDLPRGFAMGDNVAVRMGERIGFFTIRARDPIFFRKVESSVGAGSNTGFLEQSILNPPDDMLYQFYKLEIRSGNVEIQLKQPASTSRLGVERSPDGGYLTDKNDHVPLDLFVLQDFTPAIQITNNTNVSVRPVLYWQGWRYLLTPLGARPNVYTLVNIGGITR